MQAIQSIPGECLAAAGVVLGLALGWLIVAVLNSRSVNNDDLDSDDWGV